MEADARSGEEGLIAPSRQPRWHEGEALIRRQRPLPWISAVAGVLLALPTSIHAEIHLEALPRGARQVVQLSVMGGLLGVLVIAVWRSTLRARREGVDFARKDAERRWAAARKRSSGRRIFRVHIGLLASLLFGVTPMFWVLATFSPTGESRPLHLLLDGATVALALAVGAFGSLGVRRLDRDEDPGAAWIFLFANSMEPLPDGSELPWSGEPFSWPGMAEVASVSTESEAELIADLLDREGVSTFIADDAASAMLAPAVGRAVRVLVVWEDLPKAKEVLARHERLAQP